MGNGLEESPKSSWTWLLPGGETAELRWTLFQLEQSLQNAPSWRERQAQEGSEHKQGRQDGNIIRLKERHEPLLLSGWCWATAFTLSCSQEEMRGNPKLHLCLPKISQRASLQLQTQRHTCRFPDPCLACFTYSGMSFRVVLSAFPTKPVNIPVLAKQCVDIAWRTRFCLNSKTSE